MPDDLAGMALEPGLDQLVIPPENPVGPPEWLANKTREVVKGTADWIKTPREAMEGVKPEVPGMWSENDEYKQQQLDQKLSDWASKTAFGEVFWPRPGGPANLTSGAGSKIAQPGKPKLTPVEYNPFVRMAPVDHDPFAVPK